MVQLREAPGLLPITNRCRQVGRQRRVKRLPNTLMRQEVFFALCPTSNYTAGSFQEPHIKPLADQREGWAERRICGVIGCPPKASSVFDVCYNEIAHFLYPQPSPLQFDCT
jgi:hypothetical protein